jgi:hypothetical protein
MEHETSMNYETPPIANVLLAAGFRYDLEDNLWYDENPNRKKYYYRVGIGNNGAFLDLFGGGYDTKLGRFFSIDECLSNVV